MSQFDVFRARDGGELLLDCQSDVLDDLDTRFVVPLLKRTQMRKALTRLNPAFDLNGEEVRMATQGAATIPAKMMGDRVISLADHHHRIVAALDMLITGY